MTLATPWQARVAATVGVPRIIIANEVTDPAGIDWLASTLDGSGPSCTAGSTRWPAWSCWRHG